MGPEEWRDLGGDERDRAQAPEAVLRMLRAECDEARAELASVRRDRDDARAALSERWALRREIEEALGVESGPASDEQLARGVAALRALRLERDTLAAALDEVRESADIIAYVKAWRDTLESYKPTGDEVRTAGRLAEQLRAALAALPTDLAAKRDARVRAEALREARGIVIEQERRAWAAAEGARSDRVPIAAERYENNAEALADAAEAIRALADEAEKGGALPADLGDE